MPGSRRSRQRLSANGLSIDSRLVSRRASRASSRSRSLRFSSRSSSRSPRSVRASSSAATGALGCAGCVSRATRTPLDPANAVGQPLERRDGAGISPGGQRAEHLEYAPAPSGSSSAAISAFDRAASAPRPGRPASWRASARRPPAAAARASIGFERSSIHAASTSTQRGSPSSPSPAKTPPRIVSFQDGRVELAQQGRRRRRERASCRARSRRRRLDEVAGLARRARGVVSAAAARSASAACSGARKAPSAATMARRAPCGRRARSSLRSAAPVSAIAGFQRRASPRLLAASASAMAARTDQNGSSISAAPAPRCSAHRPASPEPPPPRSAPARRDRGVSW